MDKLQLRKKILKKIELPSIPDRVFSAPELGVVPDPEVIQTEAIQAAIDTVSGAGGGRLVLPAGIYRTGALQLKTGVDLHLESEETALMFVNEDVQLHYPVVFSHWEATPCYNFSPLIYACDAHDIAVTGRGVLDGGADEDHWWNWHHQVENAWSDDRPDLQLADRGSLRRMNEQGVPVSERVFGPGHYLRPNFIQPIRCERVLFAGITLHHSPMWQLNPVMCRSLTVDGVTLSSHGANNDGCDPESCSGVHICNCRFDTGDDCISLKSGRDRDGRRTNMACEDVLIENNIFADGHGGIALGSEMSGGIRRVLASDNRFCSPNLTYALRLKTNARRGGRVEDIILADSVMDHVHGAAVHGTMLYEDGRNGSNLPVFHNITVENITAHGGDYGIFLEAFKEVPITGLKLKNIRIDGVDQPMRSMNWKDPVVEQVVINGKVFPRPGHVRILGVPLRGAEVQACADNWGGTVRCRFLWQTSADGSEWTDRGEGERFRIPGSVDPAVGREGAGNAGSEANHESAADGGYVRVIAVDERGSAETGHTYRILAREESGFPERIEWQRLLCRGMLDGIGEIDEASEKLPITREWLARMLAPLGSWAEAEKAGELGIPAETERAGELGIPVEAVKVGEPGGPVRRRCPATGGAALEAAVQKGLLAPDRERGLWPEGPVSRQEMATVAMQACGVNYRNASSTMPVCRDADQVGNNYGTNVARALYFGFMELEADGRFFPQRLVTVGEVVTILDRVADFAGI